MSAQIAGNLRPVLARRAVGGCRVDYYQGNAHRTNLTTESTEGKLISHKKAQEAQKGNYQERSMCFAFCGSGSVWGGTPFLRVFLGASRPCHFSNCPTTHSVLIAFS